MKFFRGKPPEQPQGLMRKADVGDEVVFKAADDGNSAYWPHVSHRGRVLSVSLKPQRHRRSLRAIYEVQCECGRILHPRGTEFSVLKENKDA